MNTSCPTTSPSLLSVSAGTLSPWPHLLCPRGCCPQAAPSDIHPLVALLPPRPSPHPLSIPAPPLRRYSAPHCLAWPSRPPLSHSLWCLKVAAQGPKPALVLSHIRASAQAVVSAGNALLPKHTPVLNIHLAGLLLKTPPLRQGLSMTLPTHLLRWPAMSSRSQAYTARYPPHRLAGRLP